MISNSFFHKFDRSSFKSFYFAATELNFTKAAEKGGATQSGVSQHIAKLEKELGASLFLRTKNGLRITKSGKKLKDYLEKVYKEEEQFLNSLSLFTDSLTGPVSYSMPESCLMSPHFEMMLEIKNRDFPEIELSVMMNDSTSIIDDVINGDIDFGFITKKADHPLLNEITFCNENYILLTAPKSCIGSQTIDALEFIEHPDLSSLFEVWHKKQYPRKKTPKLKNLKIKGHTNRIPAALNMVSGNLGATILPEHCASNLIKQGKLTPSTLYKPASGTIFIIHRKGVILPTRVKAVINTFLSFYNRVPL